MTVRAVSAPAAALLVLIGAGAAHAQQPPAKPVASATGKAMLIQTSAELALPAHA